MFYLHNFRINYHFDYDVFINCHNFRQNLAIIFLPWNGNIELVAQTIYETTFREWSGTQASDT